MRNFSAFDRYPSVATNYLLSETLAIPIFVRPFDIYGRKWFFLTGAGMFMLTSALCGASGTLGFLPIDGMNQLIVFRGLQGIGGGMTMGLAFTIIGDVFSPAERGKYQAFFAAAYGVAAMDRAHARGLAHGPFLVARVFLRKPACRNRGDCRHPAGIPLLASRGREKQYRLGGGGNPDPLGRSSAAGAHLGNELWLDVGTRGISCWAMSKSRDAGGVRAD